MNANAPDRPWEQLEEILDRQNRDEAKQLLDNLGPADASRCLDRMDQEHRDEVFRLLDPESAAELLEQLPDVQGGDMLTHAEPETAAAILEELHSDDQADLITTLEPEHAASILAEMAPESARAAETLASYPADTAGGLMVTEIIAYEINTSVRELIDELRRRADEIEEWEVQYIYVTDRDGRLTGVLPLRDVLLAPGTRTLDRVMITNPLSVRVDTGLDDLADLFDRYAFLGVPVVDADGNLCGVVHRSDVESAWSDRVESDSLKSHGIVGGEELRSMRTLLRSRRRLSWLSVNILLNILAASIIAAYQDTLSAVIALTVFLPIISDMSGCSGNQAVAVSMRELTLGVVKPIDMLYVWSKEITVGVINGIVLGLLLAGAAYLWKGNTMLGVVVGTALAANTIVAVSVGGCVPLLLRRLNMDPALASGPLLTTLTDMCGFFLVLSLASACLGSL